MTAPHPKEIPLTQGFYAVVDEDDYEKLNCHKWSVHKSRNTYYAERWGKPLIKIGGL